MVLQVNEHLQVKGLHNVYAIGDATDVKETKLGYLAAGHVSAPFWPFPFFLATFSVRRAAAKCMICFLAFGNLCPSVFFGPAVMLPYKKSCVHAFWVSQAGACSAKV